MIGKSANVYVHCSRMREGKITVGFFRLAIHLMTIYPVTASPSKNLRKNGPDAHFRHSLGIHGCGNDCRLCHKADA